MQGKLLARCGLGVPSVFRIQRRGMNRRPLWQVGSRKSPNLSFDLQVDVFWIALFLRVGHVIVLRAGKLCD